MISLSNVRELTDKKEVFLEMLLTGDFFDTEAFGSICFVARAITRNVEAPDSYVKSKLNESRCSKE